MHTIPPVAISAVANDKATASRQLATLTCSMYFGLSACSPHSIRALRNTGSLIALQVSHGGPPTMPTTRPA